MRRRRTIARAAPLVMLACVGALALPQSVRAQTPARAGAPVPVQLGTAIRPETVTVGQHFTATIRLRVPAGTPLRFPAHPDTAAAVDTAASPVRQNTSGAGYDEATVRYVLAAWDTGPQRIGLDDVVVALPSGDRTVSLAGLRVIVRSVLPADTALRQPKPPRPPVAITTFDWVPWLIAAAVLGLLALIAWIYWRWRRRAAAPLTAIAWAERELARIEKTGWRTSDPARYATAVADVLRGYLSRAIPAARMSATTRELGTALAAAPEVPAERVLRVLERADLVKFARANIATDEAGAVADEVRAILADVERRLAETRAAVEARKAA